MKDKLSYVICQTSTAHTFGNVTACVQNWLIDLFPDNLFKTLHVHSKIAHKQLRSTPKEFLKKLKPMFVMRPRIEWNSDDVFLANTLVTTRTTDLYHSYAGTNLQEFIYDRENEVNIKYQLNRHVINFDVILIFSTMMQQINYANYFLNAVRQNRPFNIETCLESYIPQEMMELIADCSGVPLEDAGGSVKPFLDYVNGKSLYPITYKLQGSTGKHEFYRYYPVKIDTMITNFDASSEGERSGQVTSNYQISFSVRCEFNSTGFYYIFSDKVDKLKPISIDDNGTLVPIFTDVFREEDLNLKHGWSLYTSPTCRLEDNKEDEIEFSKILNNSIRLTIEHHRKNGSPVDEFIEIKVRQQGKLLRNGTDYKVDYDNFKIHFYNCNTFYTYKILVCINVSYINNLLKELYKLE